MIFVILAICCSASIALIFKSSETRGRNRYAVTAMNYLTATAVSAGMIAQSGLSLNLPPSFRDAAAAISAAIRTNHRLTSPETGLIWAITAGLVAGMIFFAAFIAYQVSVNRHGASISGAYAKIGILVPMILSLVIWRQYPTAVQWAGILAAVAAMILVNIDSLSLQRTRVKWSLLLLFLFGGLAEFSNKLFQNYGMQEQKPVFLLAVFGSALICSTAVMVQRHRRIRHTDLLTGIAVGIPNLFSSFFLIRGLESVPAGVAFPVFGAGTIAVVNLGGYAVFGEVLTRKEWVAMVFIGVSLMLVNL
ncbi:MAG TPA: hypothetical protein PLV45_07755 [bacterium]|nr:hypothetical protein [bacterium]